MKKIIISLVLFSALMISVLGFTIVLALGILALVNVDPRYVILDNTPHLFEEKRDDFEGQNWWRVGGNWIIDEQLAARQIGLGDSYFVYEIKGWNRDNTGFCNSSTLFEVSKARTLVTMSDLEVSPAKFPFLLNQVNHRNLWRLESPIVIQIDHISDGLNREDGICINPRVVARIIK